MRTKRFPAIAVSLAAATLVAGCAVGPDFHPPDAPTVDRYSREAMARRTTSVDVAGGASQKLVRDMDIPGKWWELFRSRGLNALIERSLKANPSLDAAIAALRQADENVHAQEGKYFPLIQANYTPMRQQVPQDLSTPLSSGATPVIFNLHTAQVLVSYTLDVWGLNRRTVESLRAMEDSQRFQVEAAYLTLTSNVVAAAIQEASLREQITATQKLIEINSTMLTLMKRQLETGYENQIDVAAQEAQLAQVKATLPPLQKQLAQQRDLLTALAGRFPSEEIPEKFELASLHLPRDLPVSLPSKLIEQRPDVRSSQELLHSASASVGVAVANMLPNLTVSANWGYSATALPNLIAPGNQFWTLAGSATQPIFDGFTLLHEKRAAEDAYDQAAATYRGTVIGALQNVADTLRALTADADALKATVEWEHAAKVSLDLTRQQMQTGYINFLLLLVAEQAYQQAVIAVVQARAARLADTVALFQALGGGWWNRQDIPLAKPLQTTPKRPAVIATRLDTAPGMGGSSVALKALADPRPPLRLLSTSRHDLSDSSTSIPPEVDAQKPIDRISAVYREFEEQAAP
jgi:NodT family efflux transporter outer membrane factor (OMF) lipoprotein